MSYGSIVAAAGAVLSHTLDRGVRLGDVARLSDDDRRNLLLRVHDLDGGRPASFIIKKVVADSYNPADAASWDTSRFVSDWAGAEFLSTVLSNPRSARFYGGDYSEGFVILEDLGEHRSLVEPLLEQDAARAEKALLGLWTCLGAMHAGTIGRSAAFHDIVRRLNPQARVQAPALTGLADGLQPLRAELEKLGVGVDAGCFEDIEAVVAAVEDPGPFLSYVHGDPCPDNVFWNGRELRLIDFEFGGLGHALTDAAYARMLFPSCWCANRVPPDVVLRIETAYRNQLVNGCPEAQDDAVFGSALTDACGFWLVSSLSRSLPRVTEADRTWGIATMRQRIMARLEAFVATAAQFDSRPALRRTASRLLDALRASWPDLTPLPLYPAFRE